MNEKKRGRPTKLPGFTQAELTALERRFSRRDWKTSQATHAQPTTNMRMTDEEPCPDLKKG